MRTRGRKVVRANAFVVVGAKIDPFSARFPHAAGRVELEREVHHFVAGEMMTGTARELETRTVDVARLWKCLGPLERALRSLVHDFADVCWLDVVTDVGLVRVASAARDASLESALDDVASTSIANRSGFRWRSAKGESPSACDDHLDVLRALNARSFLRESLVSQDDVLGVLTVVSTRESVRYGERDQHTIEAVARGLAYLIAKVAIVD